MRRPLLAVLSVVAVLALPSPAGAAPAPRSDAPGSESYFDLARKDCVGTARTTTSKVWFTVADGVLSDTYWPTVDATNVHTLQYLVSDGSSFTDLQTRDMTYRIVPDPTGMSCTVLASDAARGYRITTTYIADPARDAVLMRVHFAGPRSDQLYVRLDPLAGGTGGGGAQNAGGNTAQVVPGPAGGGNALVADNTNTTTDAVNRSYAVPTYEALEVPGGFSTASVGYAGTGSDGLDMLDAGHALTPYTSATDGHVALTGAVPLGRDRTTQIALGFGTTQAQALSVAAASLDQSFARAWARYEAQWVRYDARLTRPSRKLGASAVREYYASINVVKASEDKTFPGAIAAGLASPWGQSVPAGDFASDGLPTYFGSYREVFARDLYEAFTALLLAGDVRTAQGATLFLFDRQQQANGSMPRNSLENGQPAPDTGGLQLDETSYPILMDWQSGLARDRALYEDHVIPAADFLVANGPADGVERWEEQSGYSPSTIAAEIAGLTAAAHIASVNGDAARARVYQATADDFTRNVKNWTVTDDGPYIGRGVPSYFIRITENTPAAPNAAYDYNLGNGSVSVDQRAVVDAGFLDLVRLGVLPASDPTIESSLTVVDDTIERQTPSGPGFYRYGVQPSQIPGATASTPPESVDGYGDCYVPLSGTSVTGCAPSGKPWPGAVPETDPPVTDTGTGHLWPVLSGERGEYEVAAGDPSFARTLLQSMQNMQSGQGLEPEQAWEDPDLAASPYGTDPAVASIGFVTGEAAGSASPLTWAQAQYARLALDLGAGRDLETPSIVTDRYVTHGMPGSLPLTISSPASGTTVSTSTVTVTGTTAPGANVDAEGVGSAGGAAAVASTRADAAGNWSVTLGTGFGTTTITVAATRGDSTGYAQDSVNYYTLPGSTVLNVTDPTGDDDGPGTYQYPTAPAFAPGGFDLTGLTVNQTASDVYVQVRIRNLVSTFGNDFGAQLLDIYVHNPSAPTGSTSTAAANPGLNYTIASPDAWSERLEAQGFAPVAWVNPSATSLGNGQFIVDDGMPGTATLVLPTAQFGTVAPGWTFTVALTGQDGYNADQARGFLQHADAYDFGVCPVGDTTDAICSVPPADVANVMDTLAPSDQTPGAATQASEWNLSSGAAVLQGVTVP